MALHTELPIYRTGVRLLDLAVRAQVQMPRTVKRALGEKITQHCVEMLDLMALANATQRDTRAGHIDQLLTHRRAFGYTPAVSAKKALIGIGLPCNPYDESRRTSAVSAASLSVPLVMVARMGGRKAAGSCKGFPVVQPCSSYLLGLDSGEVVFANRTSRRPFMVDISASLSAVARAVTVVDGKPTTTSLDVARRFSKRHDDVLRRIRNLLPQLPPEHARNFAEMFIETAVSGGRNFAGTCRKDPAYRITRDGFTLLAMGFTGKRALKFKLAYIDAFNAMEAQLTQPNKSPLLTSPALLDQQQLSNALVMGLNMAAHVQRTVARDMVIDSADWAKSRWVLSFIPSHGTTGPVPVMERLVPDTLVLPPRELVDLMCDITTKSFNALRAKRDAQNRSDYTLADAMLEARK